MKCHEDINFPYNTHWFWYYDISVTDARNSRFGLRYSSSIETLLPWFDYLMFCSIIIITFVIDTEGTTF